MLPVYWQSLDLIIHGAVSPPVLSRATRQRQYLWVNGRPVRSGLVSVALERAYGALLPPGRHPLAGLGISLPPTLLDVNVHPRKSEIKFLHERAIFAGVQEAVETVVQRLSAAELPWEAAGDAAAWDVLPAATVLQVGEAGTPYSLRPTTAAISTLRSLGQVGNTFIVASGPQGLLLLDQHAAHESLLYEQLVAAEAEGGELEDPFLLSLSAGQQRWISLLHPTLTAMRFHLEPFGQGTIRPGGAAHAPAARDIARGSPGSHATYHATRLP
jgi:DNA mismatch repair protein MutL